MTGNYAFIRTEIQTRSKGHTATGAVCYRMGLAAVSTIPGADGTERTFDYSRRAGVVATGWAAPPGTDPSWSDPITWARRIEAVDRRKNSRQCRDDVVGLPVELVELGLAQTAMQQYADRLAELHRTVVHFAVHSPARGGCNWHGHTLYPGRYVEGVSFSRLRDRTQDNPKDKDGPNLAKVHKAIWSEICRGYGIELAWSSEAPGHHLGPKVCATKRRRLVAETREAIAETIAASRTNEPVPDERTLDDIAVVASGVTDGLTVNEMLQNEMNHAQHGRPEPREVAGPVPQRPAVLPPAITAPPVLPPVHKTPQVLPPVRRRSRVLPLVRREPEVLPPVQPTPEVLPPVPPSPEVLPPTWRTARVLPPVRRAPEVRSPIRIAPEILPPVRKAPEIPQPQLGELGRELDLCVGTLIVSTDREFRNESSSTWAAVRDYLRDRRETPGDGLASRAAGDLATRARRREESRGMPPPPAAEPDRIRMLAEWLLELASRLLEQLHLKRKRRVKTAAGPGADPGPEPRERTIPPRAQSGRQEKKHGYGHNRAPASQLGRR